MKNKFIKIILLFCISISINFITKVLAEDFIFNVSELEISEDGNLYNGKNGGKVTTSNGIEIFSDNFIYNKLTTLLEAKGNVVFVDNIKNITIWSEEMFYLKNKELAYTKGASNAVSGEGIAINSNEFFKYNKLTSVLEAKGEVKIFDKIKNIIIEAEEVIHLINKEKFFTKGKTKVNVDNEYFADTEDLVFSSKNMVLSSEKKTIVTDTIDNIYILDKFEHLINDEILKGKNIIVSSNAEGKKNDKYYLDVGFFDLKNNKFLAKDVTIDFHKNMFDDEDNDPRLKGSVGSGDEFNTYVNKGSFTTCKQDDKCPPWLIEAKKIHHDKVKKRIIYKDAWLKIYDIPVVYFPKFFHPDPTVKRQSGFLRPSFEGSEVLGTAIHTPYFFVISDDKDLTIKPRFYEDKTKIVLQNEYRQKTKNTTTTADFSYTRGYQAKPKRNDDNKDSRTHFFSNTVMNLNFDNFLRSDLEIQLQKVSNDTYLKVFNLYSPLIKTVPSTLITSMKLSLEKTDAYVFSSTIMQYENLTVGKTNDRFQYIFPSYNFSKTIEPKNLDGYFGFSSTGNNTLKDTNILSTNVTNNLNYFSDNTFLDIGIKNNFGIYLKNLNSIGKNHATFKNSPQAELTSAYVLNSSFPFIKRNSNTINTLEPKLSFMYSPHQMKDHSNSGGTITMGNIYSVSRLGMSDSFEEGGSLTIGVDYRKERIISEDKAIKTTEKDDDKINLIEDYFEFKLATVIRNKEEKNVSSASTTNRTSSNIVGQINYALSDYVLFNYDFSLDNDLSSFEYTSIDTVLAYGNFSTEISFLEKNGPIGDINIISNKSKYKFNENNSIQFATRKNRKINLTEYYDLIYEYKNDCLIAGLKWNKKYYSDTDLKPVEELYFSITIVPLGTFTPESISRTRDGK